MEENMNYEEVMETETEIVETEEGKSGMGVGKVLLIGAGVALATTAVVKLAKKAWAKHKANQELRRVPEGTVIEPTDEQIMEVTK